MNATQLKGFEMMADMLPKKQITIKVKDSNGTVKEYKADFSPLTGTVTIGRITCSMKKLGQHLEMFYNVTLVL